MNIVKIPKKLKDIFQEIRSGNIENSIEKLIEFSNFDVQKNIVFAQLSYYQNHYQEAMNFDEKSLLFNEQWYAGNILTEHFVAYTYAAQKINETERAKKFYFFYKEIKENLSLPSHQINQYNYLVEQHISKLNGNKNLSIDPIQLNLIVNGDSFSEIEKIQKKNRPDLNNKHLEKIEYLLYFMIINCNSEEVFKYYENYSDEIRNENIHLDISRLYSLAKRKEEAENALLRYATNWFPVESLQIAPMTIFEHNELDFILTEEFKNKILKTPKSQ